jgi:hypothetical protein
MALVAPVMDELNKPWNRLVIVTAGDAKAAQGSVFEFIDELQSRLSGDFDIAFVGPDDEDDGKGDKVVLMTRPIKEHAGRRVYVVPEESYIKSGLMRFRVRPST